MKNFLKFTVVFLQLWVTSVQGGEWKFYEEKSVMTDEQIFSAKSDYGIIANEIRIKFHCYNETPLLVVEKKGYLALPTTTLKVALRADDREPISFNTTVFKNDNTRASTQNVKEVAEYLMGAGWIHVFLTPQYGNYEYTMIKMTGSDYSIYKVFESCNDSLSSPKPRKPREPETKRIDPKLKAKQEKAQRVENMKSITLERLSQAWYPPSISKPSMETYVKVAEPSRKVSIKVIEPSGESTFDKSLIGAIKALSYFPIFEVAPTDNKSRKFFCLRASIQKLTIDFDCR